MARRALVEICPRLKRASGLSLHRFQEEAVSAKYFPHPTGEKKVIKRFFQDETGLELSEYAVAAALVALAVVGAFTALGGAISGKITTLGDTIAK